MRRKTLIWFGLTGLVAACVYPTERSGELRVVLEQIPDLIEGEVHAIAARVLDAGDVEVPEIDLTYRSDDPVVAAVGSDGGLLAVGPGTTTVTITAVGYAGTPEATQLVRVKKPVAIDSIQPLLAQYGDTLQVFGVGLNPQATLPPLLSSGGQVAQAPVLAWVPDDPTRPNRVGVLTLWVAPPAPRYSHVTIIGFEGTAVSADSARVLREDIYEPNDTIPWDFGVLDEDIANPALAFEARPRDDGVQADWYRFTQGGTGSRTVQIRSTQVGPNGYQVFLTDQLQWRSGQADFGIGPDAWTIGPSLYACRGIPFEPQQFPADSVTIALRDLPPGMYDLIVAYAFLGGYQLRIEDGYQSVLPPDADEENDICDLAAPLAIPSQKDLTIDNPHDIDWFTFDVGATGVSASFDVRVLSGASVFRDPDLDLYVIRDDTPAALTVVGVSQVGGDVDAVTVNLAPGRYFLVVVDFAGVAASYTLTSTVLASPIVADRVAVPPRPVGDMRRLVFRDGTSRRARR